MRNVRKLTFSLAVILLPAFGFSQFSSTEEANRKMGVKHSNIKSDRLTKVRITGPEYGRSNSIVFSPTEENKVYVANYANGIMSTDISTNKWKVEFLSPNSDNAFLNNLKFANPDNPNHLFFLSTFYYEPTDYSNGLVIYNTKDQSLYQIISNRIIEDYKVYQNNPNIIIALTEDNVVLFSDDYGSNWKEIFNIDGVNVKQMAFQYDDPNTILLATRDGIYKTNDQGSNWALIEETSTYDLKTIASSNVEDLIVAGNNINARRQFLIISRDKGNSWEEVDLPFESHILDTFFEISFFNEYPNKIMMVTEKQIFISNDSGHNWYTYNYDKDDNTFYAGESITINPNDDNNIIISSSNFPIITYNGGKSWEKFDSKTLLLTAIDYYKSEDNQDEKIFVTSNTSYFSYDPKNNTSSGDIIIDSYNLEYTSAIINYDNPDELIFSGHYGGYPPFIMRSDDNGQTAEQVWTDPAVGIMEKIVHRPNANTEFWGLLSAGYDPSSHGGLIKTTDAGKSWENVLFDSTAYIVKDVAFSYSNNYTIYRTEVDEIHLSTDNGVNWKYLTSIDKGSGIWNIEINPFNDNEMIAAVSLDKGIYKTTDAGKSWTNIFDEFECEQIWYSKEEEGLIIAKAFGQPYLVISHNNGNSWDVVDLNLGFPKIFDIQFYDNTNVRSNENAVDILIGGNGLGLLKTRYIYTPSNNNKSSQASIIDNVGNPDEIINIYPNPATENISINLNEKGESDIHIYSADGKLLHKQRTNKSNVNINVKSYPQGIYIAKASINGNSFHKKFIIK
ncbi:MAG: YCF48-related protein [Hyphomicrobiales bacterium]